MADRITVARPYAKAAFREAGAGNLGRWALLLERAAATVADERVKELLGSPLTTPAQLAQMVGEVAGAGAQVDDHQRNFLRLLADNRRLNLLPEISRLFAQMKDEAEGVVDVQITSAVAMDDSELRKLASALEKRFGRKVRTHASVDPELIGGAVVRAGDLTIDGSLKARLERLAVELTA